MVIDASRPVNCGRPVIERALDGAAGARWFFAELVEPLCDSFDPARQRNVDRLLRAVIAECARHDPRLSERLAGASARTPARRSHGRHLRARWTSAPPDLCVLPSRVTMGADIAITSAIVAVVRAAWPRTRIALLGQAGALAPLVGGRSGIEVWDHPYPRHGAIRDRLAVWLSVADEVDARQRDTEGASLLVLDPDSRMTQLGLLPLTRSARRTRLFASRSAPPEDGRCLTELAVEWARTVTGAPAHLVTEPRLIPSSGALAWGNAVRVSLRARHGRPVAVCSLGVGGNPRKAATLDAEVAALLTVSRHVTVILDSGTTNAEMLRARTVGQRWAERSGAEVGRLSAGSPVPGTAGRSAGLYLLDGADLGAVGGLLGHADLLVAYDSAFQHVAAAVGTPGVVVFVEPPSATFVDRWLAPGMTSVTCDRGLADDPAAASRIEAEVITMLRASRPGAPRPRLS